MMARKHPFLLYRDHSSWYQTQQQPARLIKKKINGWTHATKIVSTFAKNFQMFSRFVWSAAKFIQKNVEKWVGEIEELRELIEFEFPFPDHLPFSLRSSNDYQNHKFPKAKRFETEFQGEDKDFDRT